MTFNVVPVKSKCRAVPVSALRHSSRADLEPTDPKRATCFVSFFDCVYVFLEKISWSNSRKDGGCSRYNGFVPLKPYILKLFREWTNDFCMYFGLNHKSEKGTRGCGTILFNILVTKSRSHRRTDHPVPSRHKITSPICSSWRSSTKEAHSRYQTLRLTVSSSSYHFRCVICHESVEPRQEFCTQGECG
jgi:hypothetical protein